MKECRQSACLILSGTFLVLCLSSCSPAPVTQEQTSASPGESAAVAVPAATASGGWLSGMPEVIPPFTHGMFSNQSETIDYPTQTVYSLYYDKVTMEHAREYLNKLKEKGFSVEEDKNAKPGNLSASGLTGEGPGRIGYVFGLQADGHVDLQFTAFKK
jgi:hypothetical protein